MKQVNGNAAKDSSSEESSDESDGMCSTHMYMTLAGVNCGPPRTDVRLRNSAEVSIKELPAHSTVCARAYVCAGVNVGGWVDG